MALPIEDKNSIFKAIDAAGLDPSEFEGPVDVKGEIHFRHQPSGSYFNIGRRQRNSKTRRIVQHVGEGPRNRFDTVDWLSRMRQWLEDLKRHLDTPDLWADLRSLGKVVNGEIIPEEQNTQFTPDEQHDLRKLLEQAAAEARDRFDLSDEEQRDLAQRVEHYAEDAKVRKKIDWHNGLASGMLGDAFNELLPLHAVKHILEAVFGVVLHLHGGGPPILGLG